jgi:hypothetical protein
METESFESAWRTACECNVLLSPAEGKALYDRVVRAPENVVEVGSYFGGSAVILAKAGAPAFFTRSSCCHMPTASSGICGTRPFRSCFSTTSTITFPPETVSPPGGVIWFPVHRLRCMIMWRSRKCEPPRTSSRPTCG